MDLLLAAVVRADVTKNTSTLSSEVVTCITTAFKRISFATTGETSFAVPITLELSKT